MVNPGDIISYPDLCAQDGTVQKGMNYRVNNSISIFLMSVRKGAPYEDRIENDGTVLIYEGHDVPNSGNIDPKTVDQKLKTFKNSLTENGKFFKAATDYKLNKTSPELIKVYEKIKAGIWVYNGVFELKDA